MGLIIYGVILCVSYMFLTIGSYSPIHCRFSLTLAGLLSIGIAIFTGSGLSFLLGFKRDLLHDMLPLLMLGIGVDDLFVICNAIDQTQLDLPAEKRLKQALRHAGPSITITSLTNALAFLSGLSNDTLLIQSFCVFACISIMTLYLSVFTIFLPIAYWDTYRVSKRYGECFGLCFCKEDSVLFCKGKLLSKEQKEYSLGPQ